MTIFQIELVDPRAKALLENLAKLNLIKIQEVSSQEDSFKQLLSRLRGKGSESPLSMEDIAKEVEVVRAERTQPNGPTN